MFTVLLVEDDDNLRILLTKRLKDRYKVISAKNGSEGFNLLNSNSVDLLITDIMMPILNGFELVNKVRETDTSLPILMLTANQSFDAKKTGFSSGTDDYLTKPFNNEEFLWRIEALLRRSRIDSDKKITFGTVSVDLATYTLADSDESFHLSKKEFELLYKLLTYPGQLFTKNQLLEDIWGFDSESSEDTVKTHISRLRNKISSIKTLNIVAVRGIGYKIEVAK